MLRAKDIMTTKVMTLDPDDTVSHALRLLVEHKSRGLPVVDEAGDFVGTLSEIDLLELAGEPHAEKNRVGDYMSTEIHKVGEETDWGEVADVLRSLHLPQVFVTHNEKLVGFISQHDMLCSIERDRMPTEEVSPEVITPDIELDCRVLVVEDGRANARFLSHVLKRSGADVTLAENGQAAVDMYRTSMMQTENAVEEDTFDVIVMDMQMPVMDGCEATRRLREEGYKGKIIAVTARNEEYDRQKCLDAGCDDYATKPIDKDTLLRLVTENIQKEDSMAVSTSVAGLFLEDADGCGCSQFSTWRELTLVT
jgi:CheY-like chemotaxis protein